MGDGIIDKYSLLHFCVGVVAYHWSIGFVPWIILNIIFEIVENTYSIVVNTIPNYPGAKPKPDKIINSISDIIMCTMGWLLARFLDISSGLGDKDYSFSNLISNNTIPSKDTSPLVNK